MPVDYRSTSQEILYQRIQYSKGGLGRKYWDYRDNAALSYVKGIKILDIGCGEGITFEKLVNLFPDALVEGIDVDPRNVEICNNHQLSVHQGSVYELPYEDRVFDTCLILEVLEHLENPEKALKEIARITKPGGRIIIIYPVDWTMFLARILCFRFKEASFDPGHVRQWNTWAIHKLFRKYGFHPIASRALPCWPFILHRLIVGERKEDTNE